MCVLKRKGNEEDPRVVALQHPGRSVGQEGMRDRKECGTGSASSMHEADLQHTWKNAEQGGPAGLQHVLLW